MWPDFANFQESLAGKVLSAVERCGDDELHFVTVEGDRFKLFHSQDCCESVTLEDVCGDLDDLLGSPLTLVEEVSYSSEKELPTEERVRLQIERASNGQSWAPDSETWTFYRLGTEKGSVTLRWYGESNGFYSEEVDFARVP